MDFQAEGDEGDEEETEEKSTEPEFFERDCILFAIDARSAMLDPVGEAPAPFIQALSCVISCMRERIISGDQDLVGVLLFGTEQEKALHDQQPFPGTYALQDMEVPSASGIHELQQMLQARDFSSFGHAPNAGGLELSNVLWCISMMFNSAKGAKNCRRRVFIVTNDDDPCGTENGRKRAYTRASDLQQAHIWLEPFFFAPSASAFDLSDGSFWRSLLADMRQNYAEGDAAEASSSQVDRSDSWVHGCICTDEGELVSKVRRTSHRKRAYASVDLCLSDSLHYSVKLVTVVKPFAPPSRKKLHAHTNEPLVSEKTQICKAHGTTLAKETDIWKGYELPGGKWIYFEPWELKQLSADLGPSGLRLIGFKDAERLKPYHNLRGSIFLEPSEDGQGGRGGSRLGIESLVRAMVQKEKIALCSFRRQGGPRLVALLPQLRDIDAESQVVRMPCGFHLVQLPWADEVRKPELPPPRPREDFSTEQLAATSEMVQSLVLPPHANPLTSVENPAAHRHYAVLQRVALPAVELQETVDGTKPDQAWHSERYGSVKGFLDSFDVDEPLAPPGGGSTAERPAKRQKAAVPESAADWLELYTRDGVEGLRAQTAPTLKEYCRANSLALGGKKDDLVSRVSASLNERSREELAMAGGKAAGEEGE